MEDKLGLHIPTKGRSYKYDFTVHGKRYSRATGKTSYREAYKIAYAVKAAAEGLTPKSGPRLPEITLDEAFDRFYEERVEGHETRPEETLARLARMAERLGPQTLLSRLTTDDLLKYQVRRRRDGVGNRTINHDIPDTLRRVVGHAKLWGVAVPDIDWKPLKQPIPAARTRFATREEKAKLFQNLPKDYRRLLLFALLTGLRKTPLMIKRSQIDWASGVISYTKKSRKRQHTAYVPITPRIASLLNYEIERRPGSEWVFHYKCRKGHGARKKGQFYPITPAGFRKVMEEAVKEAKLENWRLIHDLRHTAATDVLRASRNIAAVRDMLGHSDVTQTEKYAHVLHDDVRAAMSSTNSPRKRPAKG